MVLSLLVTTLLSTVIFVPLALFIFKSDIVSPISKLFYGGATWSIIAIIHLVILNIINLIKPFNIAIENSTSSFIQVQTEARTVVFWYLFFICIISQIILFLGTELSLSGEEPMDFALFGLGWGISEFIQRFAFFGGIDISLTMFFLFYTLLVGLSIGSTIIRTAENTKFIMFASFLKFFGELSIFGVIGYGQTNSKALSILIPTLMLIVIMAGLSMLTRKYPLEDD